MSDAVLRVRADASQAQSVLRVLGKDLREVGEGTFFSTKAATGYKVALAGVAGAVALALKSQVDYGDWLDKTSQRTGVAVETLSSYKVGIKQADSTVEEFGKGLGVMSTRMQDAKNGSEEALRTFADLGVEFKDAEGNLRPVDDVLRDVADRMQVTEDGALKTALAGKLLGEELGQKMIPLLNQGSEGFAQMAEEAKALGIVWSEEDAEAAVILKDAVVELKATVEGFVQVAARKWIPIFTDVVEGAVLAAKAVLGLDEAQKRAAAATEDAQDRINAQADRVEQLRKEINLLNFEAGAYPEYAESMLSSAKQLGEQLENEERILRNLRGELGEQAGLTDLVARANDLSAEAIARSNRKTEEANRLSDERRQRLKDEAATLQALATRVEGAGRSMEEMVGLNLRNVQLSLTQGLEAGLITVEEFDRRMLQSATAAQERLNQMQAQGQKAEEIAVDSTSEASRSFADLESQVGAFAGHANDLFGSLQQVADGTREGGERAALSYVQLGVKVGGTIAKIAAQAGASASATAATAAASNAAITASAAPAAATQAAATYGASAAEGIAVAVGAVGAGISALMGIAGIGDSGITPELFRRTTSSGHSLFVMKSGETLLSNVGTGMVERQIQLTNAVLARQSSANEGPSRVSVNVVGDSRFMERAIRVVQNRRDERGLPRSNQKRYGR